MRHYGRALREPNDSDREQQTTQIAPQPRIRSLLPTADDVLGAVAGVLETVLDPGHIGLKGWELTWSEPVLLLATCRSCQRLKSRLVLLLRRYMMAQLCGASVLGPWERPVPTQRQRATMHEVVEGGACESRGSAWDC